MNLSYCVKSNYLKNHSHDKIHIICIVTHYYKGSLTLILRSRHRKKSCTDRNQSDNDSKKGFNLSLCYHCIYRISDLTRFKN